MKTPFLLLLSSSLTLPALLAAQESCNVETPGQALDSLFGGSLNADLLNVIFPAEFSTTTGSVELVSSSVGGIASTFWFNDQQRLSDGFAASFGFQISAGSSDGLAFVVQNDKINNIRGGPGRNLGFSNGLNKYIGVGFDACADRSDPAQNCQAEAVFIESRIEDQTPSRLITQTLDQSIVGSLKDGNVKNARVSYLQDSEEMAVFINNVEVARAALPQSAEDIWGGKFAFMGFTGSNSEALPATVAVTSFLLRTMSPGSRLSDTFPTLSSINFGKQVQYQFVITDSCDQPLDLPALNASGLSVDNITATLTEQDPENNFPTVLAAQIVLTNSGAFNFFFNMPANKLADWTLDVAVNGVRAQGMPLSNVLTTTQPPEQGLDTQTIILLSVLILVLVLFIVYAVRRLDQYRKNLNKYREDIEYGKTKQQIDAIDSTVQYSMNPMVAPLDKMKERLAANEEILARLKGNKADAMDSDYTVDQLVAENEKLRAEIAEMKREEELQAAGNTTAGGNQRRMFKDGLERKEFDQQRG